MNCFAGAGFQRPVPDKNGYKIGLSKITAGNNIFVQSISNSNTSNSAGTWEKVKEIKINLNGTIRVSYDACLNDAQYAEVQIFINGIARGILHNTNVDLPKNSSYATFTEDLKINQGDLIQLWAHTNGNLGSFVSTKNMYIKSVETNPYSVINLGGA
jgi:hypothetical protein